MSIKPEPPVELVEQCAALNKEMGSKESEVILYLQDTEWGDDWRFRLFDRKLNRTVTSHLDPKTAGWHNYYLMLNAGREAYEAGVEKGKKTVILSELETMCQRMSVKLPEMLTFAEERNRR